MNRTPTKEKQGGEFFTTPYSYGNVSSNFRILFRLPRPFPFTAALTIGRSQTRRVLGGPAVGRWSYHPPIRYNRRPWRCSQIANVTLGRRRVAHVRTTSRRWHRIRRRIMISTQTQSLELYSTLGGRSRPGRAGRAVRGRDAAADRAVAGRISAGQWDQLGRTAHQFKGAAGSYGFHQLTPSAAGLEAALAAALPGADPARACED